MKFASTLPAPLFSYHTVFISDTHLFSKVAAEQYLYEFLLHLRTRELYIVGDLIGGWEKEAAKQRPASEMTKRIIALLFYHASNGTKICYVPGNHDEKLRDKKIFERRWKQKWLKNFSIEEMPIFCAPSQVDGQDGKRFVVGHGDGYYRRLTKCHQILMLVISGIGTPVSKLGSLLYDGAVYAGKGVSDFIYEHTGRHISPVAYVKRALKFIINAIAPNPLMGIAVSMGMNGVICGHSHTPGISYARGGVYFNDGDWVESCTSLGFQADGSHEIVDHRQRRQEVGLGNLPEATDPLPDWLAPYMPRANILVRHVHRIWPGRNQTKVLQKFNAGWIKLTQRTKNYAQLLNINEKLGRSEDLRRRVTIT